jgi:1-acyl-sn-glycerol-3-phosphate acyltransferase
MIVLNHHARVIIVTKQPSSPPAGPFHMWDELKAPIVPMLIFGAYDLYPVGSWVNQTGHIAVRYLKPVLHTEAENKDKMLLLVS